MQHWHVDYLLCHPKSNIESVVRTPGEDVECAVARAIDASYPVPGFGASDCDCDSHLAYAVEREGLVRQVRAAHAAFEESGANRRG